MTTWLEFWSGDHSIYVSKKHVDAHYAAIARDMAHMPEVRSGAVILDWGCGDALSTPALLAQGARVLLFDASAAVTARLRERFGSTSGVTVLASDAIEEGSIDCIFIVSVLQYMSKDALLALLPRLYRMVKPGGVLYIADVVSPHTGMLEDVRSLLLAGWKHGFFVAACIGLFKTLFSEYRRIRHEEGFTMWDEEEFLGRLEACGFTAERMPHNIGITAHRMCFRGSRPTTV